MRDWDAHFMEKAALNASMSTCASRQVGAVAVFDRRQIADGFNGNLPGMKHCTDGGCERCQQRAFTKVDATGEDLSRCVCVHAEQNIVAWCARSRQCLDGATVYSTTFPCSDCMKLLVVAGVIEVVYRDDYPEGQKMFAALGSPVHIRRVGERT